MINQETNKLARAILPVIFVIDTSGDMYGQPISIVNNCIENVIKSIGDFATSNCDISPRIGVLQVHSGVRWQQPNGLVDAVKYVFEPLYAGGLRDMGAAMAELDDTLSWEAFLSPASDLCKPIIILVTDEGQPTDQWEEPLKKLNYNNWYQNSMRVGFAIENDANLWIISQIIGNPGAVIHTSDLTAFSILFKRVVLKSIEICSESHVGSEIPSSKEIVLDVIKETGQDYQVTDFGVTIGALEEMNNKKWNKGWSDDWEWV